MSYQQPGNGNIPAGPAPGWYPDPAGFRALRWWDGTQWGPQTRPLPGLSQQPRHPYPGTPAAAPEGYGPSGQESAGRHRQQGAPQDGTVHPPGPAAGPYASFAPARPQQPDPSQPQQPQDACQPSAWPQQQAYAPGPQPQPHRAPQRRRNRTALGALIGAGALVGIIVAIGAATAHKAPSTANVAAASTASDSASAVATSSPPDCQSRIISWRGNGGLSQLETIDTDMGSVSSAATALGADLSAGADSAEDEASLQTAAASLQSDAQTAQANLPPPCVPHMRADYGAALNDASKAALDCQDAVSELGSANYSVAVDDVDAADAAMTASGSKFQAATADVQAFNNGD